MNFKDAKLYKKNLEQAVSKADTLISRFPRVEMGLTSDSTKLSAEYQQAKKACSRAFRELRKFNAFFCENFQERISSG